MKIGYLLSVFGWIVVLVWIFSRGEKTDNLWLLIFGVFLVDILSFVGARLSDEAK